MKKLMLLFVAMMIAAASFAQEASPSENPPTAQDGATQTDESMQSTQSATQAYIPSKDRLTFMVTTIAAYNPNKDIFDWDYPYVFPLLGARYTHLFTEPTAAQKVSFNANASLSPIWLNGGADVSWSPVPFFTLSAGAAAGTSWNFSLGSLDIQSFATYDSKNMEYDNLTAVKHWGYEFFLQGVVKYDFGAALSGGKQHITFTGSYRASYVGLTGAENGELWKYMFMGEQVNGLKYDATASLAYKFALPFVREASVTGRFSGYYSDRFFDDKFSNYDATFCEISITPSIMAGIGYKDIFMFSVPFTSKRNYIGGDDDKDDEPFLQSDGRKWGWGGVMLTWTHIF